VSGFILELTNDIGYNSLRHVAPNQRYKNVFKCQGHTRTRYYSKVLNINKTTTVYKV